MKQFDIKAFIENEGMTLLSVSKFKNKSREVVFAFAGTDSKMPSHIFELWIIWVKENSSSSYFQILSDYSKIDLTKYPACTSYAIRN